MKIKVKEGDVLVCKGQDCNIEFTVTKACDDETCGTECELDITCHDGEMELKQNS